MAGKINNPSVLPSARHRLARWKPRSVRKCPEQWGIPKFAGGQSHTVALPRKRLLTPYTGEAKMR